MQKLLTIVVPVYKVEHYISKCLDSCILEDEKLMSKLEVIIVNDGTPDNSAEMSRVYVKRYPQTFRQIDKENGGHGSAWNVGLKEATGKYLRFLDSDDWLTNLDVFMRDLLQTDVDLVFTHRNTYFVAEDKNEISYIEPPFNKVLDTSKLPVERFEEIHYYASFQSCTYRTSLLKGYYPLFTEGTRYDDSILAILPIVKGHDYIAFDYVLYNYLIGREEQTCSRNTLLKSCEQLISEYGKMSCFAKNNDCSKVQKQVNALLYRAFVSHFILVLDLPFIRRRHCIIALKRNLPAQKDYSYSKQINRYLRYPFIVADMLEGIRKIKNRQI